MPCLTVKSLTASIGDVAISTKTNSDESSLMHDNCSVSAGKPSWDKTLSALQAFMSKYEDGDITATTSLISRNLELASLIEKESKEKPMADFTRVQAKINARIEQEERIYREEHMDLIEIESSIKKIQEEIESLSNIKQNLTQESLRLKKKIEEYSIECAEEIEELDCIEAQMIQQIPRVKKRISLYSQATGIKWNYDNPNMVEGEIVSATCHHLYSFKILYYEI